jgi:membrane-associated phospholipid phosphatase
MALMRIPTQGADVRPRNHSGPRKLPGRISLIFLLVMGASAIASRGSGEDDQPSAQGHLGDVRRTLRRLIPNLGRSTVSVFSRQSLFPLVLGGAATSVAGVFDDDLHTSLVDPDEGASQAISTSFGGASTAAVAAIFIGGRFAHGDRFRAASYDLLIAAATNGAFTLAIKEAVQRERPNGANNLSFPSGHSSNAFAMAAVLSSHYGKKVAVPAYLVASAVGLSRLRLDQHWLSDVFAGATLGYLTGKATVRANSSPIDGAPPRAALSLAPMVGRTLGLRVAVVF